MRKMTYHEIVEFLASLEHVDLADSEIVHYRVFRRDWGRDFGDDKVACAIEIYVDYGDDAGSELGMTRRKIDDCR